MGGRGFGIVGIEDGLHLAFVADRIGDGVIDAFGSLIGDIEIFQHPSAGIALADQIALVDPLPGNAFDLPEEMQLGLAVFVLEVFVEEVLGEIEGNGAGPLGLSLGGGNHHAFTNDAFHQGLTGADHLRGQTHLPVSPLQTR